MKTMLIMCLAVLSFYLGEWIDDKGIAIGFFIGSVIAVAIQWEDAVPKYNHIRLDEEETTVEIYSVRETSDSSLFSAVLCVLGVSWLFGDDE